MNSANYVASSTHKVICSFLVSWQCQCGRGESQRHPRVLHSCRMSLYGTDGMDRYDKEGIRWLHWRTYILCTSGGS